MICSLFLSFQKCLALQNMLMACGTEQRLFPLKNSILYLSWYYLLIMGPQRS